MLSCSAVPAIEPTLLLSVMGKEQVTRMVVGSAASFLLSVSTCELKTSVVNGTVMVKDVWDYSLRLRAAMHDDSKLVEVIGKRSSSSFFYIYPQALNCDHGFFAFVINQRTWIVMQLEVVNLNF